MVSLVGEGSTTMVLLQRRPCTSGSLPAPQRSIAVEGPFQPNIQSHAGSGAILVLADDGTYWEPGAILR